MLQPRVTPNSSVAASWLLSRISFSISVCRQGPLAGEPDRKRREREKGEASADASARRGLVTGAEAARAIRRKLSMEVAKRS